MRLYEIVYIINPTLDEENVQKVVDKVAEQVTKTGGEVVNIENWGNKKLSYEIKGFFEGIYILMKFNAGARASGELQRNLELSDEVIKHMAIRLN